MKELIALNIVMTYPVFWDKYKIFRDFIQNFYDACGYEDWNRAFVWDFQDGELSMLIDGKPFSYEWLLHIGASTKTDDSDRAGYFGEGFKIAALCSLRDYGWHVEMESADWHLTVTEMPMKIDNVGVSVLAYEYEKREFADRSKLIISDLRKEDIEIFKNAVSSFYYPENPLIGELIWKDATHAVHYRSAAALPQGYPRTAEYKSPGIVFAGFQARGTLPVPFIIGKHNHKADGRDREILKEYDVLEVMYLLAERMDGRCAAIILSSIKEYWNSYPQRNVDIFTWYYVVCELIRRISGANAAKEEFCSQNPNLLYYKRIYSNDISGKNRKRQAVAWMKNYRPGFQLVQEKFSLLGYDDLEEVCECEDGFVRDDLPTQSERKYLDILESITEECFKDFFMSENEMDYKIIRNDKAIYGGMAELLKNPIIVHNRYGLKPRFRIQHLYIKENLLCPECFDEALSTYLHERSHTFGGDSSTPFSLALTHVSEILIKNWKVIRRFEKRWAQICCLEHSTE